MTSARPDRANAPDPSDAGVCLSVEMPAKEEAVRETLSTIMQFVADELPGQEGLLPEVELVLAEILNNVVEHGHSHTDGAVATVSIRIDPSELTIDVIDHGNPMPDLRLPGGKLCCANPAEMALAELPEGGFGWSIIRMLAKRIGYRRIGDRNELTVVIPIPEI